ncbi:putative Monovalent cation:proton antiporter [Hibiscus syriacus]|uniref:Monovalent cation:proton antiporter n=1 Tax=Hibiscus syriacus TaxID=106335 RepID=A0A6A2Y1Q3_HIBSY|nr:putative Monovalent cation:proton antiporter [Hibiscus syriacus]
MSLTPRFLDSIWFISLYSALFQHHFAFATSNSSGRTLRAVLNDSPSSPLYLVGNLTRTERIGRLIKVTNARIDYLNKLSNFTTKVGENNIRLPLYLDGLIYAVGFTIGSQHHPVKLLMDTGGSLTWTQCQPCSGCFPQTLPIYDRRASTTYATLPCSHPFCSGEQRHYNCVNDVCVYDVTYGGGSSTQGVASLETHPFCSGEQRHYNCVNDVCVYDVTYGGGSSTQGVASLETFDFFVNQQMHAFPNVLFGCSDASSDISFENSEISGIFGLSLGPDSILNQLSHFIGYRFSYCFAPFSGGIPHPLLVRFGEDIPPLHNAQTTMFVQPPFRVYFFYMELMEISVGNYRINFPPYTFEIRGDGSGGSFIDSGAMITQIDANTPGLNAYEEVLNVFDSYYESEGLQTRRGRI